MKNKKLLIIGDSNCMPIYNGNSKDKLEPEEIYIYKLKKRLPYYTVEQVIWGGITTEQLIDYSISYYKRWTPNLILVHSGINDVKNQFISPKSSNTLYKLFSLFKVDKKSYKKNILYNPNLIKYHYEPKVNLKKFKAVIKKIKNTFKQTKIIWIGIHGNKKINKERPNTYKIISTYNRILKKEFKNLFISDEIFNKKKHFTKDGYHLNSAGQKILLEKIIFKIKN